MSLVELSASQLKLYEGCPARWGGKYLEGLEEPDSPATLNGKAVHSELEEWAKHGKMPTLKQALLGLPLAGAPGTRHIERPLSFQSPESAWRGFVDQEWAEGHDQDPLQLLGAPAIIIRDWKTTTDERNAKTKEELQEDAQANLYAYEAYTALGCGEVHGDWVYLPARGKVKRVEFELEESRVFDIVEGRLDPVAKEIQQLYQIRPKWQELETRTGYCYAFKKQCPRFDACKPTRRMIAMPSGEKMSDFKSSIASSFPVGSNAGNAAAEFQRRLAIALESGLVQQGEEITEAELNGRMADAAFTKMHGKKAPALPKKAPPLPAKKPADDVSDSEAEELVQHEMNKNYPKAEKGFVNPPIAGVQVAGSPEEAAAVQGIKKLEAPKAIEDDLTGLNRDQLKALGVQLGACEPNDRSREATLREKIRARRQELALAGGESALQQEMEQKLEAQPERTDGAAVYVPGAGFKKTPPALPKKSPVVGEKSAEEIVYAPQTERIKEKLAEMAAPRAPIVKDAEGDTFLGVPAIVDAANERLFELHGVRDWGQIDFKGASELKIAVQDLFESGALKADAVIVDTRTHEGGVLQNTLISLAAAGRFTLFINCALIGPGVCRSF